MNKNSKIGKFGGHSHPASPILLKVVKIQGLPPLINIARVRWKSGLAGGRCKVLSYAAGPVGCLKIAPT
jgi:hypothetical protein